MVIIEIAGFRKAGSFKSASCQEESSSTTGDEESSSDKKSRGETVILPPNRAFLYFFFKQNCIAEAVVDFPLLPVTAIMGLSHNCKNIEISVSMGIFFFCASLIKYELAGTAGFFMIRSVLIKSSFGYKSYILSICHSQMTPMQEKSEATAD